MAGKILVVDDEESVRFFAVYGLTQTGWQVDEAESGEIALDMLESTYYDILLLDLRMIGMDGLAVMRQVKKRWPETMVIIITAYASVDSAIEAIRQGAFDYLRKPCAVSDIVTCVNRAWAEKEKRDQQRRLIRQAKTKAAVAADPDLASTSTFKSGLLTIDMDSRQVSVAGKQLSLTPTQYELLEMLARSLGKPVPLEQLINKGLGYDPDDFQAQETLRVHISRLRRKLGAGYIRTIRGGGYVLVDILAA